MNIDTERNKETDDIIYPRKYWWSAANEVNGPDKNDKTENSYNDEKVHHHVNNHNKNILDKESKVEWTLDVIVSVTNTTTLQKSRSKATTHGHIRPMPKRPTYKIFKCRK